MNIVRSIVIIPTAPDYSKIVGFSTGKVNDGSAYADDNY
jgi:hypothetical protein